MTGLGYAKSTAGDHSDGVDVDDDDDSAGWMRDSAGFSRVIVGTGMVDIMADGVEDGEFVLPFWQLLIDDMDQKLRSPGPASDGKVGQNSKIPSGNPKFQPNISVAAAAELNNNHSNVNKMTTHTKASPLTSAAVGVSNKAVRNPPTRSGPNRPVTSSSNGSKQTNGRVPAGAKRQLAPSTTVSQVAKKQAPAANTTVSAEAPPPPAAVALALAEPVAILTTQPPMFPVLPQDYIHHPICNPSSDMDASAQPHLTPPIPVELDGTLRGISTGGRPGGGEEEGGHAEEAAATTPSPMEQCQAEDLASLVLSSGGQLVTSPSSCLQCVGKERDLRRAETQLLATSRNVEAFVVAFKHLAFDMNGLYAPDLRMRLEHALTQQDRLMERNASILVELENSKVSHETELKSIATKLQEEYEAKLEHHNLNAKKEANRALERHQVEMLALNAELDGLRLACKDLEAKLAEKFRSEAILKEQFEEVSAELKRRDEQQALEDLSVEDVVKRKVDTRVQGVRERCKQLEQENESFKSIQELQIQELSVLRRSGSMLEQCKEELQEYRDRVRHLERLNEDLELSVNASSPSYNLVTFLLDVLMALAHAVNLADLLLDQTFNLSFLRKSQDLFHEKQSLSEALTKCSTERNSYQQELTMLRYKIQHKEELSSGSHNGKWNLDLNCGDRKGDNGPGESSPQSTTLPGHSKMRRSNSLKSPVSLHSPLHHLVESGNKRNGLRSPLMHRLALASRNFNLGESSSGCSSTTTPEEENVPLCSGIASPTSSFCAGFPSSVPSSPGVTVIAENNSGVSFIVSFDEMDAAEQ
ncbi:unnamed protein product [Notodromas monacha]|uniref:Uncharacterized protein n=1 Tax=Notodromas monacha TaxID=399045 RepID=A0A7R9GGP5_9CRUS|nr:unnamed protein product [Notodromas monacha]CAG0920636.1 unnamed protein product [Notodromas monacha]